MEGKPERLETTQGNIQAWLELSEGDAGFQLLAEEEIAAVIFLHIFIGITYTIKFSITLFSKIFVFKGYHLLYKSALFINLGNLSPFQLFWISEGLLYIAKTGQGTPRPVTIQATQKCEVCGTP